MGSGANIRSPDVLKRFRHRYLEFDGKAHQALDLVKGDLTSVLEWLKKEQLTYWKAMLRRRHEAMQKAWREYLEAREEKDHSLRKPSCVDERKAWEKARRLKEEAEHKLDVITHWTLTLEQEAEHLMPPCRRLESLLTSLSPKAVARLDRMLDELDSYLGSSGSKGEKHAESQ